MTCVLNMCHSLFELYYYYFFMIHEVGTGISSSEKKSTSGGFRRLSAAGRIRDSMMHSVRCSCVPLSYFAMLWLREQIILRQTSRGGEGCGQGSALPNTCTRAACQQQLRPTACDLPLRLLVADVVSCNVSLVTHHFGLRC